MYYTYLTGNFEVKSPKNLNVVNEFTNRLYKELYARKFYPEEEIQNVSVHPDFIISGEIDSTSEKYEFHIIVSEYTNKFKEWSDDVYTEDIFGLSGTRDAAKAAADRIVRMTRNENLIPYKEQHYYKKDYAMKITASGSPESSLIFNFIDVQMKYPYGFMYDFPLAFGIDLFEFGYSIFIPGTSLGIGFGTKVIDIHGPTAGSFLPIIIFVPLYISPGEYNFKRNDLYLTAEWGFFLSQYSYIDLSLELMLNGITLMAGWLILPPYSDSTYSRPLYSSFYAGIKFNFGEYKVKRGEK